VPPDTGRYSVTLQAAGASMEAAQAALAEQRAAIAADLAKLGVAAGDISFAASPVFAGSGAVSVVVRTGSAEEAARRMAQAEADAKAGRSGKQALLRDAAGDAPASGDGPASGDAHAAGGVLSVVLRDLARQEEVAAVLGDGHGFAVTQGLRLYPSDPAKAHQAAVAQAVAKARAEAGIYAAAMGLKILRVEAVSNAKPTLSASDLVSTLARVDGAGRAGRAEVLAGTSFAAVAVDFRIAP